jgi:hypothetical protein
MPRFTPMHLSGWANLSESYNNIYYINMNSSFVW